MKQHFYNFQQFIIGSIQPLTAQRRPLTRFKYWGLVILFVVICWGIPATAERGVSQNKTVNHPSTILAQNSRSTPPTRPLQRPTLQVGSQGTEVSELQATLKLLGYYQGSVDGVYSEETAEAVTAFQKAAGLATNGVVDQQTWNRLFPPSQTTEDSTTTCVCPESASASATPTASNSSDPKMPVSFPVLQLGMRGDAVTGLQERLKAKGYLQSPIDGVFGPETQAAVKAAQTEYELKSDGIVGTQTWLVLLR